MDDQSKKSVIHRVKSKDNVASEFRSDDYISQFIEDPDLDDIKNAIDVVGSMFSISDQIRKRIEEHNEKAESAVSWRCNDNISQFIKDENEIELLVDEVAEKMEEVLRTLVIDIDNDHNTQDTARRVAKMYVKEIFSGRFTSTPDVTAFPNIGYSGLYTVGPITIRSTCAHHFQNIVGKCWVGVVPGDEVIGLSKFARLAQHIAERPQIQEEMTTQIANALKAHAKSENIAVLVKAEHMCMTARGVREHQSDMCTTYLGGDFETNDALRAEFYSIIQNLSSFK